jgi:hypothetical protein
VFCVIVLSAAPVTHVPVGRFATLLDEVFALNTRLQRQMAVVQNVMNSDRVLEVCHTITFTTCMNIAQTQQHA